MKLEFVAALSLGLLTLAGCQSGRGTAGSSTVESGTGREEGSTPYAADQVHPFQRAGMANANIATTREEAAMDVSGSGTAELARRSAAATVEGTDSESRPLRTEPVEPVPAPGGDQWLSSRVRSHLTSSPAGRSEALSPERLRQIDVVVNNGVVTLTGKVATEADRRAIESLVRSVGGVVAVDNRLDLAPGRLDPLNSVR